MGPFSRISATGLSVTSSFIDVSDQAIPEENKFEQFGLHHFPSLIRECIRVLAVMVLLGIIDEELDTLGRKVRRVHRRGDLHMAWSPWQPFCGSVSIWLRPHQPVSKGATRLYK